MSNKSTPFLSKLESANQLILGMEGLRPGRCIPVSVAAVEAASTLEDAVDQQRHGAAFTCAVLYPIVVELVLKHIWEKEKEENAEPHHNVHKLFMELRSETRRDVENLYDQCRREYQKAIDIGQQQRGADVVAIDMANLDEALRWNEKAVKNLKYDMKLGGKSVPTGMFWDRQTVWILPSNFQVFAIELTRWATGQ